MEQQEIEEIEKAILKSEQEKLEVHLKLDEIDVEEVIGDYSKTVGIKVSTKRGLGYSEALELIVPKEKWIKIKDEVEDAMFTRNKEPIIRYYEVLEKFRKMFVQENQTLSDEVLSYLKEQLERFNLPESRINLYKNWKEKRYAEKGDG